MLLAKSKGFWKYLFVNHLPFIRRRKHLYLETHVNASLPDNQPLVDHLVVAAHNYHVHAAGQAIGIEALLNNVSVHRLYIGAIGYPTTDIHDTDGSIGFVFKTF